MSRNFFTRTVSYGQRTGALLRELQRQMKAKGVTNEDLENLLDDYSLRDLETGEDNLSV